jgi:hypothetical protein
LFGGVVDASSVSELDEEVAIPRIAVYVTQYREEEDEIGVLDGILANLKT